MSGTVSGGGARCALLATGAWDSVPRFGGLSRWLAGRLICSKPFKFYPWIAWISVLGRAAADTTINYDETYPATLSISTPPPANLNTFPPQCFCPPMFFLWVDSWSAFCDWEQLCLKFARCFRPISSSWRAGGVVCSGEAYCNSSN